MILAGYRMADLLMRSLETLIEGEIVSVVCLFRRYLVEGFLEDGSLIEP